MDTRMVKPNAPDTLGRSRATAGSGFKGPIPEEVWEVVERAWYQPFRISSNYARQNAILVAFAASLGWITNIALDGNGLSPQWHVTLEGAAALKSKEKLSQCS